VNFRLPDPAHALGINPVGQSGVLFDKHYSDQAQTYINGEYVPQHLSEEDVAKNAQGTLRLMPGH
jgi:penicillin amidase